LSILLFIQVTAELAALPKSIPREAYVKRIMDVVRNLVKYREEIDKILTDVRRVQKEINSASQTQQRSFSVADDTVAQVLLRLEWFVLIFS
jgi:hypothetical protein